jgi:mannose-6-phosphate isomerase-like protein (cupin superfamily)
MIEGESMRLISFLAIAAFAIPAMGQTGSKAEVFSAATIKGEQAKLVEPSHITGSSSSTLGDYKTHAIKASVLTANGHAEIHAHYDDVMMVTAGTATLVTGGTVVDGHTNGDGETAGSSIQGGESHTISAGDVVHVPAGTPHQLLVKKGTTYSSIVVKIRE